jgi:hypothetical protein
MIIGGNPSAGAAAICSVRYWLGGAVAWRCGVAAERNPLETVARPLTFIDIGRRRAAKNKLAAYFVECLLYEADMPTALLNVRFRGFLPPASLVNALRWQPSPSPAIETKRLSPPLATHDRVCLIEEGRKSCPVGPAKAPRTATPKRCR